VAESREEEKRLLRSNGDEQKQQIKKATHFSESPFNFTANDDFTFGIGQKNGGIELIPPNY